MWAITYGDNMCHNMLGHGRQRRTTGKRQITMKNNRAFWVLRALGMTRICRGPFDMVPGQRQSLRNALIDAMRLLITPGIWYLYWFVDSNDYQTWSKLLKTAAPINQTLHSPRTERHAKPVWICVSEAMLFLSKVDEVVDALDSNIDGLVIARPQKPNRNKETSMTTCEREWNYNTCL